MMMMRWTDKQERDVMRVKVESISDGVEIHELDGEEVLGQDARLKTFKSQLSSGSLRKPGDKVAEAHLQLCRE